jgi:membrane associated rhomboid family serine protease
VATSDIRTCYRHGDRRAGVVCQRCDNPICPDCMRSAAVGFHCPDCARKAGNPTQRAMRQVQRARTPYVAIVLVALGVAVFVTDMLWTVDLPAGGGRTLREGVLSWEGQLFGPNVAAGDWWRPITVGFVHANLIHVGFNMLLLYLLGQMLEPAMGRLRFFAAYALSLMGGSALILLMAPDQRTVGASGAVFGLMGAAIIGLRARGVDPFQTGIGPLLIMNLVITFVMPGISIAGHIGGLLAGAVAGYLMFELGPRMQGGERTATLLCLGAAAGLFYLCLVLPDPGPILPSAFDYL